MLILFCYVFLIVFVFLLVGVWVGFFWLALCGFWFRSVFWSFFSLVFTCLWSSSLFSGWWEGSFDCFEGFFCLGLLLGFLFIFFSYVFWVSVVFFCLVWGRFFVLWVFFNAALVLDGVIVFRLIWRGVCFLNVHLLFKGNFINVIRLKA